MKHPELPRHDRGAAPLYLLVPIGLVAALLAVPALAQPADGADERTSGPGDVLAYTAPVTIDGETLFSVRGVTAFPAESRAAMITDRIVGFARDTALDPATLRVVNGELDSRIVEGETLVMTVFDADAAIEGIQRPLLADFYRQKIVITVAAHRAARTREALLRSTWRAVVATLPVIVALFVLSRVQRALRGWIERRYRERVHAFTVGTYQVLREERVWAVVDGLARLLGWAVLLALLLPYLRYTLGLFPWTRAIAKNLVSWAFDPLERIATAFIDFLPDLFFLIILFLLTRAMLRGIKLFFEAAGRGEVQLKRFHPEWAEPTYDLLRVLVVALALVIAYPYIPGSNTLAFKGISVFVGVMVSLGSSSAIANIIAGYILIYRRTFRAGDVIRIGNVVGRVTDVRLQVTSIRTIKNEEVIVPNSTIVGTEVMNYSSLATSDGLILHTTVGIGYETPWQQVEAMLLEAASRTPGLLAEPKPFVLQTALGDFAVTHQINVYCDTARTMAPTYAALHRNILDVFNEYGVQIMTPAYEGDPEKPKVVAPADWYAAPAVKASTVARAQRATAVSEETGDGGEATRR